MSATRDDQADSSPIRVGVKRQRTTEDASDSPKDAGVDVAESQNGGSVEDMDTSTTLSSDHDSSGDYSLSSDPGNTESVALSSVKTSELKKIGAVHRPKFDNVIQSEAKLKERAEMYLADIFSNSSESATTSALHETKLQEEFDGIWKHVSTSWIDILTSVRRNTERRSRSPMEVFLYRLNAPKDSAAICLLPELPISTAAADPTRFQMRPGWSYDSLSVTGIPDWVVISITDPSDDAGLQGRVQDTATFDAALTLLPVFGAGEILSTIQFLIIEAKSRAKDQKDLLEHLPQVVMQAFITMKKTSRLIVPWILSDGLQWLFGIAYEYQTARLGYSYFAVPPLYEDVEFIKANLDEHLIRMTNVWRLLSFWSLGVPEVLRKRFFSAVE